MSEKIGHVRRLFVLGSVIAAALLLSPTAFAATIFTANPSPLVAGQPGSITVSSVPRPNTLIVMPGADFIPINGSCATHLRMPAGYWPSNIWYCGNPSAPIVFVSSSIAAQDLLDGSATGLPYSNSLGYVGFVATGGRSRGVWTVSYPSFMFGQSLATGL